MKRLLWLSDCKDAECGDAAERTVVASPRGTVGEASRVRHRQSRRTTEGCGAAGQSGTASASRVSARETVQQCSRDGQWAALRWTDARRMRMLSVAEGA